MKKIYLILLSLLLIFFIFVFTPDLFSQAANVTNSEEINILWNKEASGFLCVNSNGWGFGFKRGVHSTGFVKRMLDIEFCEIMDPKEHKITNYYQTSNKSYIYGKLNDFYVLRVGYGKQKIINNKPIHGGVELRYLLLGGISLGITKPIYLKIIYVDPNVSPGTYIEKTERYDPAKHDVDNIFGSAPFTTGLDKAGFHPGLFGKFGLNFEYGANAQKLRALEAGIILDAFLKPVSILAFHQYSIFYSLYLSFNFGKRYN